MPVSEASVAVFIDADNLSSPNALDEAWSHLCKLGWKPSVFRAYGGNEKLAGLKEALRKYAIRAFVNQGKGTTDVALVVDAMDLLHSGQLPVTVVILSSDLDFAPLAVRLRESGRSVHCFAVVQAAGHGLSEVYDTVSWLGVARDVSAPLSPTIDAVHRCLDDPAAIQSCSPAGVVDADEEKHQVERILQLFSDWQVGEERQLNKMGTPLREVGLHGKNKPLHVLFRKFPDCFEVLPLQGHPRQVKLLRNPVNHG